MLIHVQYKKVLDPICNFLGMYLKRLQIHLLTTIHLFLSRYHDSSPGYFSPWYSKLVVYVNSPDH